MVHLAKILATFFGGGYSPIAPGTVGSIFACLVVYALSAFVEINFALILGMSILTFLIGKWSIDYLSNIWIHDDNKIVVDEALGIFVSLLYVPYSWQMLLCGLIVFRFFDIVKPLGIRRIDKMNSNYAVMFDDVLAGIYTNIILQIIFRWGIVSL